MCVWVGEEGELLQADEVAALNCIFIRGLIFMLIVFTYIRKQRVYVCACMHVCVWLSIKNINLFVYFYLVYGSIYKKLYIAILLMVIICVT